MTRFKKNILFIHRWLGFISGLVVFIVSITGCLFVFQDEIQDAIHSYRKIEVQQKPYVQPSELKRLALQHYPKGNPAFIAYYGPDRPAVVMTIVPKLGTRYIYLNPYTGKFLHDEDITKNFFIVVEYIHLYLLLPDKIGRLVVGISVIVFVILLISGLVLWWPKRKSDRKRSFNIKWNGRWRRVNYDLHNVLGFYACSIALILALSGLSIAFDWMRNGIYSASNLCQKYPLEKLVVKSDTLHKNIETKIPADDMAFTYTHQHSPLAQMFFISEGDKKGSGTTTVTPYYTSMHYYRSDSYTFDQYSGKLLKTELQQHKSPGRKMNDANYDIHVGQIIGLPGKIIAFIVSLICASLPVTGFIVWFGKRKKKKRNPNIRHHKLSVA
ncbi:PepSY-associated TM helix domain-containing protein [Mucilaginibacter boryungensis]|uniref:PepSY domain-containing protein n=1 Tax=Mucilaginibacter boryungensis TaxID=768480 RepID=A0ABR9XLA2_9SPHI|nr:PepSY-associated TM helix domain-containing protein [Mucilaginibacter boryungensis]MBE9668002.1 PepSY domain-containing protein [Mucilaginibacter boryungensis]